MPNRVEEVRFNMDRVRLNGVSAPPLPSDFTSSKFGVTGSPEVEDSGGVALVILRSNGRRGVGRKIGGPSEGMLFVYIS